MTYGKLKEMVLMLINQYSIAGDEYEETYNNQADYLAKIINYANDAIMEVATTYRKIPVLLDLTGVEPDDLGKQVRYELPEDFYQFRSGGVVETSDGRVVHTNTYATQGRKHLLLPKQEDGDFSVEYYRYPELIPGDADADYELDNTPETHTAIAYYVAALLVRDDNAFAYSTLYNKYETKLAKMAPDITAEVTIVEDAYFPEG